jgi:F-type H+-transporting ATPase subunit a
MNGTLGILKTVNLKVILAFFALLTAWAPAALASPDAEGHAAEHHSTNPADFVASDVIMGHILDSHEWHITDLPNGTPIALHLPWMLYSSERGFEFFMLQGHSHHEQMAELEARGYRMDEATNAVVTTSGGYVLDLSLTKAVLHMLIVALAMILVFRGVANGYKKNEGKAPKGVQSLFEPIIVFIRDEVAKPNLHGKHERFVPYLLTLFFFIWFANLFGLTPLNSNIMGNISVTAALAFLTFVIVTAKGTKDYWQHILWYPGVPLPVKFIMLPVEVISMFVKPSALMIRLFANITAGHFMVTALIVMIFIIGKGGENAIAGWGTGVGSLLFNLFIMSLEVLVAIIQAYVFTLLTAVFIGQAMETHHHDEHHAHEGHH